ncbi:hypothetical protein COCMIDRAFT_21251 [Bipolaris oryzae ATCC 44560]|uniref:Uncharacterized protein n=1 Tax=Bipolaris oryzae ATCC 44560 TaxID=930090 RepID=W6ZMQ6_COCMI|nr:uncharacterized protein COCMIDRAFT_21251 [Bipolaris oryzae ATCC 44560]EUC51263.1 hypothetical protein COCMIDRAFT_21251 [Bipolaris oryzae ATCC 44560]
MRTTLPPAIEFATVPISAILLHTGDWSKCCYVVFAIVFCPASQLYLDPYIPRMRRIKPAAAYVKIATQITDPKNNFSTARKAFGSLTYSADTLRKPSSKPKFHGLRRWVTLSLIGLNAIKLQTAGGISCVAVGLKQAVLFNGDHGTSGSAEGLCCKGCEQLDLGKRAMQFASRDE